MKKSHICFIEQIIRIEVCMQLNTEFRILKVNGTLEDEALPSIILFSFSAGCTGDDDITKQRKPRVITPLSHQTVTARLVLILRLILRRRKRKKNHRQIIDAIHLRKLASQAKKKLERIIWLFLYIRFRCRSTDICLVSYPALVWRSSGAYRQEGTGVSHLRTYFLKRGELAEKVES